MKLLHTADWHLGKRLDHVSRLEEQRAVLQEICEIADRESVDAILIAGDLFDHANPSVEALELFYQTLRKLTHNGQRAVIGIAGNHDSPDRIAAPDPLARASGIFLAGYPDTTFPPITLETGLKILQSEPGFLELQLPNSTFPLRLLLTPYANELRLRKHLGDTDREEALRQLLQDHWQQLAEKYCDEKGINLLMTHLFVCRSGETHPEWEDEEEKSTLTVGGAQEIYTSNFPKGLHYAALGHLHGYRVLQEKPYPIVYSSSPLSYSFGDPNPSKYVVIVEVEPGESAQFTAIPLTQGKPTLQPAFNNLEEALTWLHANPETWVSCTLMTDHYLTAQDRKRLLDAHTGIVRIIPQFREEEMMKFTSGKQIDLSKSMEELFTEYFTHRKGMPPNEAVLGLFQEVLNEDSSS